MALTKQKLSKIRSQVRTEGHQRRRQQLGIPEPTAHERKLRRLRNQRYQQNKRQKEFMRQKAA